MSPVKNANAFRVIDSHTGGEPTRTIVDLDLPMEGLAMDLRLDKIRANFDRYRQAIVREPRGSEIMVGAHLMPPIDPNHHASVVFFNNVGYLGMCGHGMIGVIETLRFLGRIETGLIQVETVAGLVEAELLPDRSVRIQNVPSYRLEKDWQVRTETYGAIRVDIAYGGNWFALAKVEQMDRGETDLAELVRIANEIMFACQKDFPQVDHVELFGAPKSPGADSRNFVLCPGGMYDRSPCGTGTSAKLACLALDGELLPGANWVQESIVGSTFLASYLWSDSRPQMIIPSIQGRAFINGDVQVIISEEDPYAWGFGGTIR